MITGIDAANQLYEAALLVKRFHWVVRGNDAVAMHLQLDDMFKDLIEWSDRLFEDAFGNKHEGIYFDFGLQEMGDLVSAENIAGKMTDVFTTILLLIESADGTNGRSTNNILDDVAEGLANWVYQMSLYIEDGV